MKSELRKPGYDQAREFISVEVVNPTTGFSGINCTVRGEITGENITFEKKLKVLRGEEKILSFSPDEFPQLVINSPRLWWPVNKGPQNLYELKMTVSIDGVVCDSVKTNSVFVRLLPIRIRLISHVSFMSMASVSLSVERTGYRKLC